MLPSTLPNVCFTGNALRPRRWRVSTVACRRPIIVPISTADRTLAAVITQQARIRPDEIAARAIGFPDLTFAGIAALSDAFTIALRSHGVGPQDRVALLLPMGRATGVAITLTMAAAAAAPLDPAAPPAVLADFGERLRPRLAIVLPGMEHLAAPLGCPAVALQPGPSLPAGTITSTRAGMPRPDDPLVILATSGSTGAPRLVPRHHAQFLDVAHLVADHHALRPGARQLNASQPFHALGAAPLVKTLTNGACTVFAASTDPADVLAAIHAFQPTMANLAPSAYEALIAAAAGGPAIPPFKRLISSAAPFPPASARAVCALLGAPLHRDYGLSEAICLAFSAPGDIDRAPAGNGGGETPRYRPMIPGTVAIADEEGNHLPPGEEGEIVARGPHVFHGYIGGDGSEFFPGGWFRTGDLGVMAGDGSFVITGRLKHLINRGGVKISPAEIEAVLLAHPAIAAAAAIPVAHPSLGDDIAAVIVPRPGANLPAREIRRWLLDHLPASRVPRFISFRDALPITNTGKLDRRALIAETATSSDESAR